MNRERALKSVSLRSRLSFVLILFCYGITASAEVPQRLVDLRWALLEAPTNGLFFRSVDQLFETRLVAHPQTPSALPIKTKPPAGVHFDGNFLTYDEWAERTYTNALLVIRDGTVVFEDYRNGSGAQTPFIGFSMSKSIVATLVGLAIAEGHINSVAEPISKYVPELRGGGYDGVSIEHVLEMRSGVAYEERYDFGENPSLAALVHEHAIVLNRERFADRGLQLPSAVAPGSRFNYATMDTAMLGLMLERAVGEPLETFMSRTLWMPMGAEFEGFWMADGPQGEGRALAGMGFNARLRDFGRLGQMWLNEGQANGRQIVRRDWMIRATKMKPFGEANRRGGYGYQFWQVDDEPGAHAAVGLQGQYIYVHPETRTVIVKLSFFPPGDPSALEKLTLAWFHATVNVSPSE